MAGGVGYGEYQITPVDVAKPLALMESVRQNRMLEELKNYQIAKARREDASESQIGQFLPAVLKSATSPDAVLSPAERAAHEDAMRRLAGISPAWAFKIAQLKTQAEQNVLINRLRAAQASRAEHLAAGGGGGGGGIAAPPPVFTGGGPPAAMMPRGAVPPAGPIGGAIMRRPWQTSEAPADSNIGAGQDVTGGLVPTGGFGSDQLDTVDSMWIGPGGEPPAPLTAPAVAPSTPIQSTPTQAPGQRAGTRPGGAGEHGLPLDIYDARDKGYAPVRDMKGKAVEYGGFIEMWTPDRKDRVPIRLQRDREPKAEANWVGIEGRPGWFIDTKSGLTRQDKSYQDPSAIGPPGSAVDAWAIRTLLKGDPATDEYAAAYAQHSSVRVMPDGTKIIPEMRHYAVPTRFAGPQAPAGGPPAPTAPGGPPVAQAPPTGPAAPPVAVSPQMLEGETGARNKWLGKVEDAGQPPVLAQVPTQAPVPTSATPTVMPPPPAAPKATPFGQPQVVDPDKPHLGQAEEAKLRKLQVDAATLLHTLGIYSQKFREAGSGERVKSVAGWSTALNTAWANTALLAKGDTLYELGVLNGPDLGILQRVIADPATLRGGTTSPDDLDAQVALVADLVQFRLNEHERRGGKPITPDAPLPEALATRVKALKSSRPGAAPAGRSRDDFKRKYEWLE